MADARSSSVAEDAATFSRPGWMSADSLPILPRTLYARCSAPGRCGKQIAFFESELGLTLVEEEASAKLFPASNRARDVRDGLLALAGRRGARFFPNTTVTGIAPAPDGSWQVEREGASPLGADAVIVATGGLSVPNTG